MSFDYETVSLVRPGTDSMKSAKVRGVRRGPFENAILNKVQRDKQASVRRVVRLLALAHRIDALIRTGEVKDMADAARRLGMTRARMTQIAKLMLLAPEIQEALLTPGCRVTERKLRPIVAEPLWTRQIELWNEVKHERDTVLPDQDGTRILRRHDARAGQGTGEAERATGEAG